MGPGRLLPAGGPTTDVCMCVLPAYPQDHRDGGDHSDKNGPAGALASLPSAPYRFFAYG